MKEYLKNSNVERSQIADLLISKLEEMEKNEDITEFKIAILNDVLEDSKLIELLAGTLSIREAYTFAMIGKAINNTKNQFDSQSIESYNTSIAILTDIAHNSKLDLKSKKECAYSLYEILVNTTITICWARFEERYAVLRSEDDILKYFAKQREDIVGFASDSLKSTNIPEYQKTILEQKNLLLNKLSLNFAQKLLEHNKEKNNEEKAKKVL